MIRRLQRLSQIKWVVEAKKNNMKIMDVVVVMVNVKELVASAVVKVTVTNNRFKRKRLLFNNRNLKSK